MATWIVHAPDTVERDGVIVGNVCQAAIAFEEESAEIMAAINAWNVSANTLRDERIATAETKAADLETVLGGTEAGAALLKERWIAEETARKEAAEAKLAELTKPVEESPVK